MRTFTKNVVGVISLGVLAGSWSLGQAAETGLVIGAPSADSTSPAATSNPLPSGGTEPSPSAMSGQPSSVSSPTATSAPAPSKSASSAPSQSPTNTATPTPTQSSTPGKLGSSGSATSDNIAYKYGYMQVQVVKENNKIIEVNLVKAGTRGSEYASVPGMLADAAITAQGSNFGNVSGATYTTNAFKQALESALAKF